eukprot:11613121-Alexandrium_andersonii.AAC.1
MCRSIRPHKQLLRDVRQGHVEVRNLRRGNGFGGTGVLCASGSHKRSNTASACPERLRAASFETWGCCAYERPLDPAPRLLLPRNRVIPAQSELATKG